MPAVAVIALGQLVIFCLFACSPPKVEKPTPRMVLEDCPSGVGIRDAQCGSLEVFEDRNSGAGRKISLNIVVLPAIDHNPLPDPLFFLAGGPGMGATEIGDMVKSSFRRVNRSRDIVLVDQRGTGSSNPLDCEFGEMDFFSGFKIDARTEELKTCLEELRLKADPRLYTTPIAMDDLDEVRVALGYERINLYGGSYGTRAALIYLRRHSEHVRTVVLDGLAPTALKLPLYMGADAQRSLDIMLTDCENDESCSQAFPDIRSKFYALLDRLERNPQTVRVRNPLTAEEADVEMHRLAVAVLVRSALYQVEASSLLPLLIERAHAGDFQPLIALGSTWAEIDAKMSKGMLLSVICSEDMPRITDEERSLHAEGNFLRGEIFDVFRKGCDVWPKGELPADYYEPIKSDRPVLVLSGELDPVTPPRWGEEVSRHLSASRHIIVPGVGHGTLSYECLSRLVEEFIDKGSVEDLNVDCVEKLHRPPFFSSYTGPRIEGAE